MYRIELRIADRNFYSEELSAENTAFELLGELDQIPGVGHRVVSLQRRTEAGWEVE